MIKLISLSPSYYLLVGVYLRVAEPTQLVRYLSTYLINLSIFIISPKVGTNIIIIGTSTIITS